MRISGPLYTRMSKKYSSMVFQKGLVLFITCGIDNLQVALVELHNGSRLCMQVAVGESLTVGDVVSVVLRLGFISGDNLRFYIPKLVKDE